MNKLYLATLLCLIMLAVQASHFAGGELTYRYIGDSTGIPNQYKVMATLFRESAGATMPTSVPITVSGNCITTSNFSMPLIGNQVFAGYNRCSYPTVQNEFEIFVYRTIITVPANCTEFTFALTTDCCRNYSDNLLNTSGQNLYLEARGFSSKRNSSSISSLPGPRSFYSGVEYNWLNYFSDADGDSLHAQFVNSRSSATQIIPYSGSFTVNNPFSSDPAVGITLDAKTGNIHFKSNTLHRSVVSIKVAEYRYDSTTFAYIKVGERIFDKMLVLKPQASAMQTMMLTMPSPTQPCTAPFFDVNTTTDFTTPSLASDGSDFILINPLGHLHPIQTAEAKFVNQYHSTTVRLYLYSPFVHNGTYKLVSMPGNDGNTLISDCHDALPAGDTVTFTVENCSGIGTQEINMPQVTLRPNPVFDVLHIHSGLQKSHSITLYNAIGVQLHNQQCNEPTTEINMRSFAPGVYIVTVNVGSEISAHRIIKQ